MGWVPMAMASLSACMHTRWEQPFLSSDQLFKDGLWQAVLQDKGPEKYPKVPVQRLPTSMHLPVQQPVDGIPGLPPTCPALVASDTPSGGHCCHRGPKPWHISPFLSVCATGGSHV